MAGYGAEVHKQRYSNYRSASVVFDSYPKNLTTTDNTRKYRLACYFKEKSMRNCGTLSINTAQLMLCWMNLRK